MISAVFLSLNSVNTARAQDSKHRGTLERIDDMEVFVGEPTDLSGNEKGASKRNLVKWPDGVLPIRFPKGLSAEKKDQFFAACDQWSKVAPVRCIEGSYHGRRIKLTTHKNWGCFALWGMGRHFGVLKRRMNLAPGCWSQHTIMHEIGHAFGLIHEHQRTDRDSYIKINYENVNNSFMGLLRKINFSYQAGTLHTPYDFLSIMHYSAYAFSANQKITIEPKPDYAEYLNVMGLVRELSEGDKLTINAIYNQSEI
jgi:hypothetical protein